MSVSIPLTIRSYQNNVQTSNDRVGYSGAVYRTEIIFTPSVSMSSISITVNLRCQSYIPSGNANANLHHYISTDESMPSVGLGSVWFTMPYTGSTYDAARDVTITVTQDFSAGITYHLWLLPHTASGNYGLISHQNAITAMGEPWAAPDKYGRVAGAWHGSLFWYTHNPMIYHNGAWHRYAPKLYRNGRWADIGG